jgi:predicted glycosyltransferase
MNRARRLEELGLLRVLPPEALTPERLAAGLVELLAFQPRAGALDLQGAERIAALLQASLQARDVQAAKRAVSA